MLLTASSVEYVDRETILQASESDACSMVSLSIYSTESEDTVSAFGGKELSSSSLSTTGDPFYIWDEEPQAPSPQGRVGSDAPAVFQYTHVLLGMGTEGSSRYRLCSFLQGLL